MSELAYLNLDLLVEGPGPDYRVRVLASPAGDSRPASFRVPFSDLEVENFLLKIGRPRRNVRRINPPQVTAIKHFGGRLFEAVFPAELRINLAISQSRADADDAGLRIRLRFSECPELSELPWEYLYDSEHNRFLCLSDRTPLVRYLEVSDPIRVVPVTPPLRILVVIANPSDLQQLDSEQEWRNVTAALSELTQRGRVEVERLAQPTLSALQRQLRRNTYHIFHFIGHGGFDPGTQGGMLAMEDDHGRSRLVAGDELGTLLHNHRSLRLALLNSCEGARGDRSDPFSGTAQSLIQQGIPAVVAMQFEITDDAAITFGNVLYEAIADGYPLDAATTEARIAVYTDDNLTEWGTPVLYLRAPDGRIFDIQSLSPAEQARREAAEQQARLEAEEQARRATAEQQARREAEEQARRAAAEQQARREAEEQARRATAEQQARREAEEQARRATAEQQARREAEEQARRATAEQQARREAEEQARQATAEQQARREADQRPGRQPQNNKPGGKPKNSARQATAEQQARREAEEQARREAEQRAAKQQARPVAPAGLRGSSAGDRVDLRWDPPVAGSAAVVAWELRRDGSRVGQVTEPWARDQPPGRGTYRYTVTALGADGQHSADSNVWIRPSRRPLWLVPALAILAAVLATAGILQWAPWQHHPVPPAVLPLVAPAGLTGDVSGAKIALRWNGPPAGTAAVAYWRVLRDGKVLIEKVTGPQATVPNQGFHSYTVVAVGEDGQDSAQSQSWQAPPVWQKLKTGLRESFSLAGVAAQNSEVWVAGGQDANGKRDEVMVFNPQTNKWRNGPPLPKPISHAPLVSAGDKLYLLGGLTTEGNKSVPLATVYSLDTKTGGDWIEEAELPAPRYGGAAAWDGKRLIFAGGTDTFEANTPRPAAADIWELRSGKWKTVDAVLQPGRDRLAAATDGKGSIWLVGGAVLSPPEKESAPRPKMIYDDVEVLHGDKISDSTPISTAIHSAAAVWTPDTGTCVFGGNDGTVLPNQTARPVAKVQCLEGTNPRWPDMPEARQNAGAAVIDSTVYVVGSRSCSPCRGGAGREPDVVLALRFG